MQGWDLKRLWLSAFYHVDDTHLVYNMISLLWKGAQLETTLGSGKFAAMIAVLLGLSHGLAVVSSLLLSFLTRSPTSYYSCAVGFSGVLFALKVVLNYNSPSYTNIYGLLVPSRYAAWVELLFIQMFVPGTSFVGHLCGILAGLIYMNCPAAISGSLGMWPVLSRVVGGSRHRTYGRGSVGSRRDSSPPPSSSRVWRCQSCTYDNSSVLETCDMCGAARTSNHYDDAFSPSAHHCQWLEKSWDRHVYHASTDSTYCNLYKFVNIFYFSLYDTVMKSSVLHVEALFFIVVI